MESISNITFNKKLFISFLVKQAHKDWDSVPKEDRSSCAKYVRNAIEHGIKCPVEGKKYIFNRKPSAYQYGEKLEEIGLKNIFQLTTAYNVQFFENGSEARLVNQNGNPSHFGIKFKTGDILVMDNCDGHPHGHIQAFDGERWVSNYIQKSVLPKIKEGVIAQFRIYR